MSRLFVDMDGTLSVFRKIDAIEELYEQGFFISQEPHQNVVDAVKLFIKSNPETEVYILSAYLVDSKYALEEKNKWLDRYVPEIPQENRIFVPCGSCKRDSIENVNENDFLLDDYTHNLNEWSPPAHGIKLMNGINHTKGTWKSDKVFFDRTPEEIVMDIESIMCLQDEVDFEM